MPVFQSTSMCPSLTRTQLTLKNLHLTSWTVFPLPSPSKKWTIFWPIMQRQKLLTTLILENWQEDSSVRTSTKTPKSGIVLVQQLRN
ncbi:wsv176 [White spot syndrome virus]|uniref:Wsv176 n=4 Tax=White spot syndrome virus TaxID=342409 RepID=Q8VB24_WSSVS|nr:wsv176 [Shrimp white spot syndrome virus]AFX59554.1 wsv176 [White spot syndrome virus]AAL33180.1 wsv176 [Shrimp white spot syndrome virus]AAL89100.1 WSSV232 [Shrimp white spot syndrome virus]AWQ60354.1 wsv176 [Shrimp white spot syndrome virus]AWQ60767.1 wsv176 [Shrimp white spot syndrome virus]